MACAGRPKSCCPTTAATQRGGHGGGLPASARAARHRPGQRPAGGVRLGARREALGRRRRSTSGAWTAPTASTPGAPLRGGETYRLWGNRGSARYVGLQSMAGMASSANVLLDELDLGPERRGRSHPLGRPARGQLAAHRRGRHDAGRSGTSSTTGTPRWRRPSPSSGSAPSSEKAARPAEDPRAVVARQLIALGDFVVANLEFFLQFSRPETPNTFLPPLDGTAMGAAAENRPVIGSWELGPDEALLVEVSPPAGPLLELLAREPVVGDHRLRLAPEQPQRAPGDGRRRRHPAHRHRPRGPGRRQLARHRRAQRRARSFCAASAPRRRPCRPRG